MAEIQSPISGGIQAVRRTVASSAFSGAAPAAPAQPDPVTTNLLSQNSFALSSVSGQLASISQQIGQLNFSLTNIQSNLALQAQLAEQGLREGKEGAVEQRIQSALLKPVQAISQKAQFTLGRLASFFSVILAGWLGSKLIQFLRAKSDGNIDLMSQIRDAIIGGLITIGGIFLGINLAIKGLSRLLVSISGTIFRAVGSGLIIRPMKALMGLFGKAANLAYSIITKAVGGSVATTAARNAPAIVKWMQKPLNWVKGAFMGGGKKPGMKQAGTKDQTMMTGGGGIGTTGVISTGLDIASGRDPVSAAIVNAISGGAAFFVGKGMGGWKRILAQFLTFEAVRNTGYMIGTPNQKGIEMIGGSEDGNASGVSDDRTIDEMLESEGGSGNIMPAMMTPISDEDLIRERELANESKKPQGFMRGLAGVGDFITGNAFDFDKRGSILEPKKKDVNVAQNISSLQEPAPSLINIGDGGASSPTGGAGGGAGGGKASSLPTIPSSNDDNPNFLAAKFYGVALA